jgi:predicted metal-dependent phosphoesterase TrpH
MSVDLHIHTKVSDGSLSPSEVVSKAFKKGLKGIAITDHDTIQGIDEALAYAKRYPDFVVVPGIEISTEYQGEELHVLGYFIDHRQASFIDSLNKMKDNRENRALRIINKLKSLGITLNPNIVNKHRNKGTIGRPHIAQGLVDCGYAKDVQHAFERYLLKGMPAYVARKKITPEEAIRIINEAGGVPVLAHPGLLCNKGLVLSALNLGFKGVEIEYPLHSTSFKNWLRKEAGKKKLLITGGSDYHGKYKKIKLGEETVPFEVIKKLHELKKNNFPLT